MKDTTKYICIVIIIILVTFIGSGLTYIFMQENKEKEQSNNKPTETLKSGIKLIDTKEQNDQIIQEYEIILNGKRQTLNINFSYNFHEGYGNTSEAEYGVPYEEVIGTMNGHEVYFNSKNLEENTTKKQIFTKEIINKEFNTKNFNIIKGTDNLDYFTILMNKNEYNFYEAHLKGLYVFNDGLKQLAEGFPNFSNCHKTDDFMTVLGGTTGFEIENENNWYPDTFNICDSSILRCYIGLKIENNKIYYLYPDLNYENSTEGFYGYMEEREYTINNNKLEYKTLNKYKIISGAGATC